MAVAKTTEERTAWLRLLCRRALERMARGRYFELVLSEIDAIAPEEGVYWRTLVAGVELYPTMGKTPDEALRWMLAQSLERMDALGPPDDPVRAQLLQELAEAGEELPVLESQDARLPAKGYCTMPPQFLPAESGAPATREQLALVLGAAHCWVSNCQRSLGELYYAIRDPSNRNEEDWERAQRELRESLQAYDLLRESLRKSGP